MMRFATTFATVLALATGAWAQVTTTPGPGGIPIAPGAPVRGWTPGGTGIGGSEIAPGPAARTQPMYRTAPGGEPVLVMPERERTRGATGTAAGVGTEAPCRGSACLPEGLRLTVAAGEPAPPAPDIIDSPAALGAALRGCWTPPETPDDIEMSVRFSFRRSGQPMGQPFITYATRGASADAKNAWRRSITAALDRCAPFRFSPDFAAAAAGRPLSVRFTRARTTR